MTCPHCRGAEKIFDQGTAERELKAYRAHGPGTTTRLLIAALVLAFVSWLRASASVPTIRFASAAIGLVGTIWTIQRISGG